MKKPDKFKNFTKKSLFAEKLEQARQQKIELKKTPHKVESKSSPPDGDSRPAQNLSVEHKNELLITVAEVKPEAIETAPKVESETSQDPNEVETVKTESDERNFQKTKNMSEFRQIMERRYEESMSLTNPLRINLGIDLGTSFSKVVWRMGETSFPLRFGENSLELNDYFFPSIVAFGARSVRCGAKKSEEEPVFSLANFKMCLACESERNADCNPAKCGLTKWNLRAFCAEVNGKETAAKLNGGEAAFVNAFFLSKVLAQTKKSVVAELEERGFRQPFSVKWMANVCVPEIFIERSPVSEAFDKAFKTASLMAEVFLEKPDLCDRKTVFACYLAAQDLLNELERTGSPLDCFLYSEIGAQVASVVLSKTTEEGLYAFVDIGAGTVDASVFRFKRDGAETKRPPYSAGVFKTGAAHIETRANRKFSKSSVEWLRECKENYRGLIESERGRLLNPVVSFLDEAEQNVKDETNKNLIEVFRQAFQKELGNERESWQNLKLILGGGGAKLKIYQDAAIHAFSLNKGKNAKLPDTVILPKPDDFQMSGLSEADFHRFAVAYGLSRGIENLPEIIFTMDVLPMTVPGQRTERRDRDDDR